MAQAFQLDAFQNNAFQIDGSSPGVVTPPRNLASTNAELVGLLDLAFDPTTHDFVDSSDGTWLETTDSRTSVIFQMESTLNGWWADASQGSRIREIIEARDVEDPADISELVDEVKRCLQVLVDESVIVNLTVTLEADEVGRPVILMMYLDRSSGQRVDLSYVPFAP